VPLANPDIEGRIFFALPSLHHLKALQLERMPHLGSKLNQEGCRRCLCFSPATRFFGDYFKVNCCRPGLRGSAFSEKLAAIRR